VRFAEFSPNGQHVVTASYDQTARIWDARTGQVLVELKGHKAMINRARFDRDGGRVVTASSDRTARIWDARTGKQLVEVLPHNASVYAAEFSSNGERVVTASEDNTALIWDARTGRRLAGPLNHNGGVWWAMFSPDGMKVVTAAFDKTARVWDVFTGQPITEPLKHKDNVRYAHFSPDGQRIVTPSHDGTAQVWDAQTGQRLTEPLPHDAPVVFTEFSPDGQWIVSASEDNTARIWEVPQTPLPIPPWLAELAEAIAGGRFDDRGNLETVPLTSLAEIKVQVESNSPTNVYTRWGQWFFADRKRRNISPASLLTMAEWVQQGIEGDRAESGPEVQQSHAQSLTETGHLREPQTNSPNFEGIPARDPRTPSNLIDLSAHYTAGLDEDWHGRQWKGNNLSRLPSGRQTLGDVEFDVRGILQLASPPLNTTAPGFPDHIKGIQIHRHCQRLHFLHSTGWGNDVKDKTQIGTYLIRYADGQKLEIPILNGVDLREWQVTADKTNHLERATVAWNGRTPRGANVQLFKRTWNNPRPEMEIEGVDFSSARTLAAPFLIAITVE
jgi:hypothetical protein